MHKMIIDTDPGIDDAQAIAYAIAHPAIQLLGLTTVFGNAGIALTTKNALLLLDLFGAPEIPVAQGAAVPLVQAPLPPADFVHGTDGLGNLNLSPSCRLPVQLSAAEFIVQQANAQPGEITLITLGPLTNVALAVELDPLLPGKIRELVVMGGTVDEPGNVTPLAEANFLNDPHAADRVFALEWPVTVIGLDVTHRILLGDSHLGELRHGAGATGRFLWDSSRFYVDFYTRKGAAAGGSEPACAMHDAAAVVFLLERDAFDLTAGPVRVIEEGIGAGQLAIDRKGYHYLLPYWQNRPVSYVAMQVDAERVRRAFLDTLIQHASN